MLKLNKKRFVVAVGTSCFVSLFVAGKNRKTGMVKNFRIIVADSVENSGKNDARKGCQKNDVAAVENSFAFYSPLC